MKRDDLTGFAGGGNKARKLEYLIGEAIEQGADAVVTCGAIQSNFVRQLGAACRMAGLECHAALMELPFEEGVEPPRGLLSNVTGNPQLNQLFGVHMHIYVSGHWSDLYRRAEDAAEALEGAGKRVYRVPIGGSTPLGAYAFTEAAGELNQPFEIIVTASSSGSTQVGLAMALPGTRVVGMGCDPEPEIIYDFEALSKACAERFPQFVALEAKQFEIDFDAVGPGYGVPSELGQRAMHWMAQTEGILLDPIYSAKAFGALMKGIEEGRYSGKILFWHTGGVPSLFGMPEDALKEPGLG